MNSFKMKCFVSVQDHGDAALTIILNKYGAKNIIFHWSDLTVYKAHEYVFLSHNIYFLWGDIHYDFHSENFSVDRKINIGCIYKKRYNEAVKIKEDIVTQLAITNKERKIVTFFDESFDNATFRTEYSFFKFLKIINEFCELNREVEVFLKPKVLNYELMITRKNFDYFKKLWAGLMLHNNFKCLNPSQWGAEEIIAISDVCINMDMNTPATIALICGKDALYFDNSGNTCHPFAKKFKNKIVFDDKNLLFQQIDSILNKKFNCREVISEKEIRGYDAFCDDNALERLRDNLYELTNSRL